MHTLMPGTEGNKHKTEKTIHYHISQTFDYVKKNNGKYIP